MPGDQLWVHLMPKPVVFYLILFNRIDQWFGCYGGPALESCFCSGWGCMPQPQSYKGDRKACCSAWKRNQLLKHWSFRKFQPQGLAGRAAVWAPPLSEVPALPFSLGVSLGSWPGPCRRSGGQRSPQELQPSLRALEPPRHSGPGTSPCLHSPASPAGPEAQRALFS